NDRDRLRDFIASYPASPLAETAKNRLATIDRAVQERDEKAKAEREAALKREEDLKRARTAETERKTTEREAARQREEAARRAEAERATQDRQTLVRRQEQDEACARDEHQLVRLRGSANMGWAREDLKRLEESTTCERTRAEVTALLSQPPDAIRPAPAPEY